MLKLIFRSVSLPSLLCFVCVSTWGQTEDVRAATGLPIPIGQPVIYGQITIRGISKKERKPILAVTLLINGAQVDKSQTNDKGFYYFLRSPSEGAVLVFDVDGAEIGRDVLTPGLGKTVRRDIAFDWNAYNASRESSQGAGVTAGLYTRSNTANKDFEKALQAKRAGDADESITLLKGIVEKDPKDFVVWTELGTIYHSQQKIADAEHAYGKALEQKSDFFLALMNLGKLQITQKQFERSVVTFTKAAQADLNSADAFHYLGESYLQLKQGSKAVIALNEAIRLAPQDKADIHLRLATLYTAAGAKQQAVSEYKLFLQKRPDYKDRTKIEQFIKDNS